MRRKFNLHPPLLLAAVLVGICQVSHVQGAATTPSPTPSPSVPVTLFQNVRIFDGKSASLSPPSQVLIKGNTIERISLTPITVDTNATVIPGNGRVLMPGLIDAHWHAFMVSTPQSLLMTANVPYLHLVAARQAEATLMRGFTTVRDMGGYPRRRLNRYSPGRKTASSWPSPGLSIPTRANWV